MKYQYNILFIIFIMCVTTSLIILHTDLERSKDRITLLTAKCISLDIKLKDAGIIQYSTIPDDINSMWLPPIEAEKIYNVSEEDQILKNNFQLLLEKLDMKIKTIPGRSSSNVIINTTSLTNYCYGN